MDSKPILQALDAAVFNCSTVRVESMIFVVTLMWHGVKPDSYPTCFHAAWCDDSPIEFLVRLPFRRGSRGQLSRRSSWYPSPDLLAHMPGNHREIEAFEEAVAGLVSYVQDSDSWAPRTDSVRPAIFTFPPRQPKP